MILEFNSFYGSHKIKRRKKRSKNNQIHRKRVIANHIKNKREQQEYKSNSGIDLYEDKCVYVCVVHMKSEHTHCFT